MDLIKKAAWHAGAWSYILFWLVKFLLSLFADRYISLVFLVLSLIEVSAAVVEGSGRIDRLLERAIPHWLQTLHGAFHWAGAKFAGESSKAFLWFSIIFSFGVALILAWHHHHLAERVKRHQIFLSRLRGVFQEAKPLVFSDGQDPLKFVKAALELLSHSWAGKSRSATPKLVVTVLEIRPGEDSFQLKFQFPDDVYQFPAKGLPKRSAAGKALELDGLVYVPWTYFSHGVRLSPVGEGMNAYTKLELVEDAFVPLPLTCSFRPRSTISFVVPLDGQSDTKYVLCLDSDGVDHFRQMDYETVNLLATLIGIVLKNPKLHPVKGTGAGQI